MSTNDFTLAIVSEKTPSEVFNAINDVKSWWQGEIIGPTKSQNDEFSYQMETFHFSKQKVVELIPDKKVVWLVTESQLSFTQDKSEWTGTKICFDISTVNNTTQLHFTHIGLTPQFECYGDCSKGWTQLIEKSLVSLINTGKGVNVF